MTPKENVESLLRRRGFEWIPVCFDLCPSQRERFKKETGEEDYPSYFSFPWRGVPGPAKAQRPPVDWTAYHPGPYAEGTSFDDLGVGHEPGGKSAFHMTRMLHPMRPFSSLEQFQAYPYPDFSKSDPAPIAEAVKRVQASGLMAMANQNCTVWESSWYMRGMEELMMDMLSGDECAAWHLDKMTSIACDKARAFATAGVELLHLGDDIGMQKSVMMSPELYREWLKPRLAKVIREAKKAKPDIIISYHSCGYIEPFIPDLIEVGVEVLNPIQPECMPFERLHAEYGDVLSFWGSLGTQSTLPLGSAQDVRKAVLENLKAAGRKGGLLCTPTHLVEPEVPWENIMAYVDACKEFSKAGA